MSNDKPARLAQRMLIYAARCIMSDTDEDAEDVDDVENDSDWCSDPRDSDSESDAGRPHPSHPRTYPVKTSLRRSGHQRVTRSPYPHSQLASLIYLCRYPEEFLTPDDMELPEKDRTSIAAITQRDEAAAKALQLTVYVRQQATRDSEEEYTYDRVAFQCLGQWIQDVERVYAIRNSRCYPSRDQCKAPNDLCHTKYFGGPYAQEVDLQFLLSRWEEEMPLSCGGVRTGWNGPGILQDVDVSMEECRHKLSSTIFKMAALSEEYNHQAASTWDYASSPFDVEEEDSLTSSSDTSPILAEDVTTEMAEHPDGCAVNHDGTLKDASQMSWPHSPSQEEPPNLSFP